MNKDFLSWLGHAGSHTCMIQNAGTTYYFVRVQKNEDFDYLYCQRQYSGKGLARGGRSAEIRAAVRQARGILPAGDYPHHLCQSGSIRSREIEPAFET